jgi:rhodanese-related sulfurtransferase
VPRRLTRRFHVPSALRPSVLRIDADHARGLLAAGGLLVDVRREDDPVARLDGALRLPPDMFPERLSEFRRDVPIVLACA